MGDEAAPLTPALALPLTLDYPDHQMSPTKKATMDITPLHEAHLALLAAATKVADAGGSVRVPPPGEWNADQILAHVTLVDAATIAAVSSVAAGANTTFDNRVLLDRWTIDHVNALAGGNVGLRHRIRHLGEALCTLGGDVLSDAELDTLVPSLLLSNDKLLVNEPVAVRTLIAGLAENELPGHTGQLLALLPLNNGHTS